jgi:hypothetical protein
MFTPVKRTQKLCLWLLLAAGLVCVVVTIFTRSPKWCGSAGLIFDIAGIVQLEISGLFDRWLEKYGDIEKYPRGPPSRITREIVDDPEKPIRMWVRGTLYFDHRAGFWLLVVGFIFQLAAIWLAGP